jgi:hypothetical protein
VALNSSGFGDIMASVARLRGGAEYLQPRYAEAPTQCPAAGAAPKKPAGG